MWNNRPLVKHKNTIHVLQNNVKTAGLKHAQQIFANSKQMSVFFLFTNQVSNVKRMNGVTTFS